MRIQYRSVLLFLPLLALFIAQPSVVQQASPTPTYDPLVEPPLSDNPTEYELGRNLYWHWCMTCHGDRGQGLTDEFRGIWEPEHQNCWGRGCHAGRSGDEGFPIPTVVPALVSDAHLGQFASVQELASFLKETHPPQSPGILKDEEYRAIALFVFTMNERSPVRVRGKPTVPPQPTRAAVPPQASAPNWFSISTAIIFAVFTIGLLTIVRRTRMRD